MAAEGKEYRLEGCFGRRTNGDVGLILGTNYTNIKTSSVSLSSCLETCASAHTPANATYPYVGVAGGNSCYCGYQLDATTAIAVDSAQCTTPCQGNATEACGGANHMSVYKLATADGITMLETTDNTGTTGGDASNDMSQSTGDTTSPGVAAGIAMGTILGVALLLALVLLGVKWRKRRILSDQKPAEDADQSDYQLQIQPPPPRAESDRGIGSITSSLADLPTEMGRITSAATSNSPFNTGSSRGGEEKVAIRDATMVDLKRLSGIVVDGCSSPRKGIYAQQDGRASASGKNISYIDGNIRQIDVAAASSTTGAQWRHTQNLPLTPRTPRHRADSEGLGLGLGLEPHDDEPTTALIPAAAAATVVQEPDCTAQGTGLGDRAWHRRRLSMPFLPSGGEGKATEFEDDSVYGGSSSSRRGHNNNNQSGRSSPNWRPATGVASSVGDESVAEGSLSDGGGPPTPRALRVDVVSQIYDDDDDDADEDEDGPALSPSWFWTVSNLARLSDAGIEKTSKME